MKRVFLFLAVILISQNLFSQKVASEKVAYKTYVYKCYHCGKISKKTVIDVMSIKDKDVSDKVSDEAVENGYSQGNLILNTIAGYSDEDNTTCHGSNDGVHSYNEISRKTIMKVITAEKGRSNKKN